MEKIKLAILMVGTIILTSCGNKAIENNAVSGNQFKGTVNTIKEAKESGRMMKCTYKIGGHEGLGEYIAYINGNKYKIDSMGPNGKMWHLIFDGDSAYDWGDSQNQGVKRTLSCFRDAEIKYPTEKVFSKTASDIAGITGENTFNEAVNVKCIDVSKIDFSIPTGVTFIDQCEYFKKMINK